MQVVKGQNTSRFQYKMSSHLRAAILCALGLLLAFAIEMSTRHVMTSSIYLPLHTILEFISIVVCFAVFVVGWYGYRQTENRQDLFIAAAFLAVGAIDLIHTLSYQGMPDFISENTAGKAAAYWLVARLIGSIALLIAAFIAPNAKSRWIRPGALLPAVIVVVSSLVAVFSVQSALVSELMFKPETGLTMLKIGIEYLVIGIYILAFLALGHTYGFKSDSAGFLRIAIIFAIAGEFCFTLYQNPYDAHNLLGHINKVISYYFVLQALFVSSLRRPYTELSRANKRLQESFTSIGEALGSGLHKDSTLRQMAALILRMFDADLSAIGELKPDGIVDVATFDGIMVEPFSTPLSESLAGDVFSDTSPKIVADISDYRTNARFDFAKLGLHSMMWAPILREGRPIGAIYAGSREVGKFTSEDANVLTAFAQHAAIALANAEHYEREHRIAESLQSVLFPPRELDLGTIKVSGRYKPAWDEAQIGGDFYDYFDLGDGMLAITIGDVSGKGLNAAVHTAIVKYSFQAYMRDGLGPAEALQRISEAMRERSSHDEVPDNIFITMFCAILDIKSGRMVYASAGHEPPIKYSTDGNVVSLDSTGPILGIFAASSYNEQNIAIDQGDTLVLYTDGITEARSNGKLFGQEGLIESIRDCNNCSPNQLAEHIHEQAAAHARGVVQDDVAIVIIKRS